MSSSTFALSATQLQLPGYPAKLQSVTSAPTTTKESDGREKSGISLEVQL